MHGVADASSLLHACPLHLRRSRVASNGALNATAGYLSCEAGMLYLLTSVGSVLLICWNVRGVSDNPSPAGLPFFALALVAGFVLSISVVSMFCDYLAAPVRRGWTPTTIPKRRDLQPTFGRRRYYPSG